MGEARRRKEHGADPHEKAPKTYLWPRAFLDQIRARFEATCRVAKVAGYPPPSEDAFVKAVLSAGFAKMDAEIEAARTARASRIVVPGDPGLPAGQRIVVVGG